MRANLVILVVGLLAAPLASAGDAIVLQPIHHDISPPLRELPAPALEAQPFQPVEPEMPPGTNRLPDGWRGVTGSSLTPHHLQTEAGGATEDATVILNIEGLGNGYPGYPLAYPPPDTTGAVGADHFVQWVNVAYAFFDKATGDIVDLPGSDWRPGNAVFDGFGGPCETTNNGDPVVLYDQLADRWLMSQLALPNYLSGPFFQCVAVSTSSDPTGSWHRASYEWPLNRLNDYPKLAVWPDGYYLTVNEFDGGTLDWRGAAVAAFDRDAFLTGDAPAVVYFDLGPAYGGLLPVDLDGHALPPAGTPGMFVGVHNGYSGNDALQVWKLAVDWSDPGSATFGIDPGHAPNATVPVTSFGGRWSAPQPGGADLDVLSDRLMFRASYRVLADHDALLVNHSVNVVGRNGVRWYELRDPAGTPVLAQEGTFSPDAEDRWMGSIAMDGAGNIAVGYSVSSTATSPSIRVTGRLASDPPGQMTLGETSVQPGTGYQSGTGRWGDYSTMTVDPVDDCTFWYTHEYTTGTGSRVWGSRIVAFQLSGCEGPSIFADDFESGDTSQWSGATR